MNPLASMAAVLAVLCMVSGTFAQATAAPPPAPAADAPAPSPAPEQEVNTQRLLDAIAMLPTKRAGWGDQEHRDGLRRTETVLVEALTAMGFEPELEPVDFLGSGAPRGVGSKDGDGRRSEQGPFYNVIVEIKGTQRPSEVLLFGAHHDAVPYSPGADDNATGVAVLLEMARLLKDRPMQRTLRLVFFTLEEAGLVGARVHAQRVHAESSRGERHVVGMASMDMLGYFSDEEGSQTSPVPEGVFTRMGLTMPTRGDFLGLGGVLGHRAFSQRLVKAMSRSEPDLKVVAADFLPIAPPDMLRSDHAPFLLIGVPAVILSDTANFRNPHYHQQSDTLETIDPAGLTRSARALVGAAWRLAGPEGERLIDLPVPTLIDLPAENIDPATAQP